MNAATTQFIDTKNNDTLFIQRGHCYVLEDFPYTQEFLAIATSGDSDDQCVEYLEEVRIDADETFLKEFLKNTGAWDDEDIESHDDNLVKLVFLMAWDIKEDEAFFFSL